MEVPTSEDASSANLDSLKLQIAKLHMNASRKAIIKLLESLRHLSGKVKDLEGLHFDQPGCNNNKELINNVLTENAKVEEILLGVSSSTRKNKFCITEKPAENMSQEERLESVTEEKLEATSEVGKDSSEQLTNVKELSSDQNAQITKVEQVTNDLPHINVAPENKEETLESVQQEINRLREEINRQLEEVDTEIAKLRLDVKQTESELAERKTELEDLRQQNSELYTQFETANKEVQNAENNLIKVKSELHKQLVKKSTLQKQNKNLSVTVSPEEASED